MTDSPRVRDKLSLLTARRWRPGLAALLSAAALLAAVLPGAPASVTPIATHQSPRAAHQVTDHAARDTARAATTLLASKDDTLTIFNDGGEQGPPTADYGQLIFNYISLGSGLEPCVDDWQYNHSPYAVVTSYPCSGGDPAEWWGLTSVDPNVSGEVFASAVGGDWDFNACLDVENMSTRSGAPVILWPCDSGDVAQLWRYTYTHQLVNPNSGMCLTIPNWDVTPTDAPKPIQLIITPCVGGTNQLIDFSTSNG